MWRRKPVNKDQKVAVGNKVFKNDLEEGNTDEDIWERHEGGGDTESIFKMPGQCAVNKIS